jgi:hypothetical protein
MRMERFWVYFKMNFRVIAYLMENLISGTNLV